MKNCLGGRTVTQIGVLWREICNVKSVAGWPAYQCTYQLADHHAGTSWPVGRAGAKTSLTSSRVSPASQEQQVSDSRRASSGEEKDGCEKMRRNMKIRHHKVGPEITAAGSPVQTVQCYGKQDFTNSAVCDFVFQPYVYTMCIPQRFVGCCLEKTV